jgi:hypothetical protein
VLEAVLLLLNVFLDVPATALLLPFDTLMMLSIDACFVSLVLLPALSQTKPDARAAGRLERFSGTALSKSAGALRLQAFFMLTSVFAGFCTAVLVSLLAAPLLALLLLSDALLLFFLALIALFLGARLLGALATEAVSLELVTAIAATRGEAVFAESE